VPFGSLGLASLVGAKIIENRNVVGDVGMAATGFFRRYRANNATALADHNRGSCRVEIFMLIMAAGVGRQSLRDSAEDWFNLAEDVQARFKALAPGDFHDLFGGCP